MRRYRGRRARAGVREKLSLMADLRPPTVPPSKPYFPSASVCRPLVDERASTSHPRSSFLQSDMAPLAPAASESTPLLRPSSPSPSWLSATRQGEHEDSAIDIRIRRDISELAGGHESEDEEDFIGRSSFGQAVSPSLPVDVGRVFRFFLPPRLSLPSRPVQELTAHRDALF